MTGVRPVLLAVVLGIALMHHLGGMQHGAGCADAGPTMTSTSSMTSVPAHDLAVPRHDDTTGDTGLGGMLHLCLAVLAAVATALVLVVLAVLDATPTVRPTTSGTAGDGHSRAPPGPRRLAQLQLLRI